MLLVSVAMLHDRRYLIDMYLIYCCQRLQWGVDREHRDVLHVIVCRRLGHTPGSNVIVQLSCRWETSVWAVMWLFEA